MKKLFFAIPVLLLAVTLQNCIKDDSTNTSQSIVDSDSSDVSGRLYVDVYNGSGNSKVQGAQVSLYLTYDDMMKNIDLYTFSSNSQGRVDFGYVLQGNYYITGYSTTGGLVKDSSVAQILPKRVLTRKLFLH